ncbi:MAG: glycoside hydrolase family 3 C-terminal domain-containing protein [Methylobacteriaceae bacterium]|nr:glycoside hydrolase family 3 C-terminal domain-containing protein [Methylobacteriaceae bacterium]
MTLAERIGQLNLVPNGPAFDRSAVEHGAIGGIMGFASPREIAGLQAVARRAPGGVPLLVGLDVLHGLRTMAPLPLGEAASFDPDLARETARMAAREAAALGMNWTFAPMVDIARDPRWGRMVEGAGEDPLLGSLFAESRVRGFREGGLAVTLKHFAGYGAASGGRDYDLAEIAPGTLHDLYLPPFRAGIEAGAESVMSAFHALNGVPATASSLLLTDVLRRRWGYDGFVVSDWQAIPQLIDHGVAAGEAEAARKALLAGVDLDMASDLYARHLASEVAAGRIPEAAVTEAARRVLRAKLRMGLFDRPPPDALPESAPAPTADTRAIVRRAARDSMVLLRNEGVLPLAGPRRIVLVGEMATSGRALAGPHGALERWEDTVTILAGLQARAARDGATVAAVAGCALVCDSDAGFAAAETAARDADLVVAVLGEPVELTGEGGSRASLALPDRQSALLDRLLATGKPVILVLVASRPIELGPALDRLAGLLMAWFPGTEGGNALADILFGDESPSAKLPVTWPRTVGQVPLTYDTPSSGRPFETGNRFTLRYADQSLEPLFPFGFGLTYSRFDLTPGMVGASRIARDGALEVRATLTNAGPRAAREVVQLYIRQRRARVVRPLRQLKAFEKVALGPGESREVVLRVPFAALGYTREDGTYAVEPGPVEAFLGTSSAAARPVGTVELVTGR